MYRGLVVVVIALAGSVRAEEKPSKAAEEFKTLSREFLQAQEEFSKAVRAAKPEERKDIIEKQNPAPKFFGKFLAFAEKNAQDPVALDALFMSLRTAGRDRGANSNWDRVMQVYIKDHVASDKIGSVVGALRGTDDEASIKFRQTVLDKNPSRKIQALAVKSLAASHKKSNKEEAEKYEKLLAEKYAGVFPDLSIGKPAPEVVNKNLEGKTVKLSELRGKVVVLDIWATWCPPCKAMIPHEREMVKKLEGKPFVLVSVSADEKKETLSEFLKKEPMPWTHWWNGARGGMIEDWSVEYFPTIYVLDARGVIRYKDVRGEKMEEAVNTLLKEMEADTPKK